MNETTGLDRKLQERLLLGRRVENDRLVLADAVLLAALDGSRPLTANERAALQSSPLTVRRLRHLALERRAAANGLVPGDRSGEHEPAWHGSAGMLRAADSGAVPVLATDDGCFRLHFAPDGPGWRVILQLSAEAPFAARLLREHPVLQVLDGAGAVILEGRLDADGECEDAWPFGEPPAQRLQQAGAAFSVRLLRR